MRKKDLVLVAVIAFIFGVAGSVIGLKVLSPQTAVAQEDDKVVVAEQFVILNADGNPAAMLTKGDDGGAGLYLYDGEGDVRALIAYSEENGPLIVLSHPKSEPGAVMVPNAIQLADDEKNTTFTAP